MQREVEIENGLVLMMTCQTISRRAKSWEVVCSVEDDLVKLFCTCTSAIFVPTSKSVVTTS